MIRGLVQGVGFRPFICRLAAKHGLFGEVDNRTDGVSVIIQGDSRSVDRFSNDILSGAPPASQIKSIEVIPKNIQEFTGFFIVESKNTNNLVTEISPDIGVCPECLNDLSTDKGRINYAFINCTNCGPRFSIIEGLPYDRSQTSMKVFRMCGKCQTEYNDILDRRFHAQPIACNECGPEYLYSDRYKEIREFEEILEEVASQISFGKTVGLKGIGGYYLICDALQNEAVLKLRMRKHRDQKPFAVMFRDTSALKEYCFADRIEVKELTSWRRPILLLREKKPLAESVSNGLRTTGAFLPYMPIHFMLFKLLKTPALVMTSGNLSEEPIITDDDTAEKKLATIADSLVSYNRAIINRVDDSVVRVINNRVCLIRRSRGFVPRPVDLRENAEGILAVGAEEKNAVCIGKGTQAVMSQYIGDLKNLPACDFFRESIIRLSDLFRFMPEYISCDLHPDYYSTQYASELGLKLGIPVIQVQHHHAHIASCMAEHGLDEKVIGVSLDGTGYGTDGNIWGGEFLVTDCKDFARFSHFDYVPMPGGDRAVREPWRMALAYLFSYFGDTIDYNKIPLFRSLDQHSVSLVKEMMKNKINTPDSSGAGRLFDAVSALLGLCPVATFDSEGPMRLESAINEDTEQYYPYRIDGTVKFGETLKAILNDMPDRNVSHISAKFHNTVARVIHEVAESMREVHNLNKVVLSGGVFQNKYLHEKTIKLLNKRNFEVFSNHQVPANDGGIALGQLKIALKRKNHVSEYSGKDIIN